MLRPESELREVSGVAKKEIEDIRNFMQGAVYSWIKNRPGEYFAIRDLMGGENFFWEGTPLLVLYQKHIALGKSHSVAIQAAGQDLGWIVKSLLARDKRTFECTKAGLVNIYRWVGNER